MRESSMALENRRYWRTRRAVEAHASKLAASAGEEAALAVCEASLRGDVLEIGCGAGRMSARLHRGARSYAGIDYSLPMIARARQCHPELDFRFGDARDLSAFADRSFDAVCMFGSAIDDVERDDRARVLSEVRRVLRARGAFLFSSHNLETAFAPAWSPSWLRRGVRSYLRGIANALRNRSRQIRGEGWAIVNDPHDAFSLLTYYTTRERQLRELEEHDFGDAATFGVDEGVPLAPGDVCRDYAICYAAFLRG